MIPESIHPELVVKICGIRDRNAADVAVRAGASTIGVMLAPSSRRISPDTAREIASGKEVPVVGVVVNEPEGSLHDVIARTGIDIVQLSGDEAPDLLDTIEIPVIKTIRVAAGGIVDDAKRLIDPWLDHRRPVMAILLDAHVEGQYGGTGRRTDWTIAAALAGTYPIILAGGLTAANVGEGIRQVAPYGVDVSSGVETNGNKDHSKIRAFVASARAANGVEAMSGGGTAES